MPTQTKATTRQTQLLVGTLGGILLLAVVLAVVVWSGIGDAGISGHGYTAMLLGVLFTVGLGAGVRSQCAGGSSSAGSTPRSPAPTRCNRARNPSPPSRPAPGPGSRSGS